MQTSVSKFFSVEIGAFIGLNHRFRVKLAIDKV